MQSDQLYAAFAPKGTRFAAICAALVILALVIAACGGESAAPAEPTQAPAEAPTEAPTEAPAEEAAEEPEEAAEEPAEEAAEEEAAEGEAAEGEAMLTGVAETGGYLVTIAGGCGCHFNRDLGALAGGNRFEGPFGVAFARNLTPDPETGLGEWSEAEIAHAIRTGERPDGTQLVPAMPYHSYSALSLQDAHDIAAYLHTLDPVANEVPEREVTEEPEPFTPAQTVEQITDPVERGMALVNLARCGQCHTPSEGGVPNMDLMLAGADLEDEVAPNITPDEETGIGSWSAEDVAHLLQTGERPDGSMVEGSMATQVERRFSQLTEEDALAIGEFIMSLPPVSNDPGAE